MWVLVLWTSVFDIKLLKIDVLSSCTSEIVGWVPLAILQLTPTSNNLFGPEPIVKLAVVIGVLVPFVVIELSKLIWWVINTDTESVIVTVSSKDGFVIGLITMPAVAQSIVLGYSVRVGPSEPVPVTFWYTVMFSTVPPVEAVKFTELNELLAGWALSLPIAAAAKNIERVLVDCNEVTAELEETPPLHVGLVGGLTCPLVFCPAVAVDLESTGLVEFTLE